MPSQQSDHLTVGQVAANWSIVDITVTITIYASEMKDSLMIIVADFFVKVTTIFPLGCITLRLTQALLTIKNKKPVANLPATAGCPEVLFYWQRQYQLSITGNSITDWKHILPATER